MSPFAPAPTGATAQLLGTRGSIPVSGKSYLQHGGNTTCLHLDIGDENHTLIFDAGTGIRELGPQLLADKCPSQIHLFLTHTHWDHIQGLPFFTPLYHKECRIHVYGDQGISGNLENLMRGQWAEEYFPVAWDRLRAEIEFHSMGSQPLKIGEALISRSFANHPGTSLAYKIEYGNGQMVFMPDNEFLKGYHGPPTEMKPNDPRLDPYVPLINFIRGADLLISEAQYSAEEYLEKSGWGHTSLPNACLLAAMTDVKRWVLVHHDPSHDDAFLERHYQEGLRLLNKLDFRGEFALGCDGDLETLAG